MNNKKRIIGLTGGIGSGKSTVALFLEQMKIPVYYSDNHAKSIVTTDTGVKNKIINLFGPNAYLEDGTYNKAFISKIVFDDEDLLAALNHIIHPAVKQDFENWLELANGNLVFKETALLFELGLEKECFRTLLVTASAEIRLERVSYRDSKTHEQILSIMNKQMSEEEKNTKADYIISNNGTLEDLKDKTRETLSKIKKEIDLL